MDLIEVDSFTYFEKIGIPYHFFNQTDFNKLNQGKCEKIFFLLPTEKSNKTGLIAGLKNGILCSPFSAPFGSYSSSKLRVGLGAIECTVDATEDFARRQNIKGIKHILPPLFYGKTFISKMINIFYRKNYETENCDLNHYYSLRNFDESYLSSLPRNGRKNLAIGLKSNLAFHKCSGLKEEKAAYSLIKENRKAKNFPLRMNFEEVKASATLLQADFFIVKEHHNNIASAIVFHVAPKIVQVIYWGDTPGFTEVKPMNFLSCKIFEYYSHQDIEYVDIGPSSEHSIPNYGLNEFKESIGCESSPKFTFFKNIY